MGTHTQQDGVRCSTDGKFVIKPFQETVVKTIINWGDFCCCLQQLQSFLGLNVLWVIMTSRQPQVHRTLQPSWSRTILIRKYQVDVGKFNALRTQHARRRCDGHYRVYWKWWAALTQLLWCCVSKWDPTIGHILSEYKETLKPWL